MNLSAAWTLPQKYSIVCDIPRSLLSVKDINIEVSAAHWGKERAEMAAQKQSHTGTMARVADRGEEVRADGAMG